MAVKDFDFTNAVSYHTGAFPPKHIRLEAILPPLMAATATLARYDEMLRTMINSQLLLAPLRRQDAVSSSRMEGTISTLEDVYRLEAEIDNASPDPYREARDDDIEVYLYSRALRLAQEAMLAGQPLSEHLIRSAHQTLLGFGRGAKHDPGAYKTQQNYVGDTIRNAVHYIPIAPEHLGSGMQNLFAYIADKEALPLVRTAIAHVEFEALHPFQDGNGRIGRMLITLMLWHLGLIRQPHFFVSGYFETHKAEYVDRMRAVSEKGGWTEWVCFFLTALDAQGRYNIETAEEISALYAAMREQFRAELSNQWYDRALDYVFANPVFRNDRFVAVSGVPETSARVMTRKLVEVGLLRTLEAPSGRRAALYAFDPLLKLLQNR